MKTELVLLAHTGLALLYARTPGAAALQPLARLQAPDGPAAPARPSRAGHGSADHRPGGIAFEPRLDPRHKQRQAFAEQLAQHVEGLLGDTPFDRLVVFASPPLLGELRARLGPRAAACLGATVPADLTALPADEIARRVDAALAAHGGRAEA